MRDYAALMTALAAGNLTVVVQLCFTDADVIEIALAAVMFAAIATAIFEIVTGIIESDIAENLRLRQERKARQRRRRGPQVLDTSVRWEMIEDETGRHFWL